jgi:hypothetical protein
MQLVATPAVLWPPNKKMLPVQIEVEAVDTCDESPPFCAITGVSSNERRTRRSDWQIEGDLSLSLKAKRRGKGPGRVYTIGVECVDSSGNASVGTTEVLVPHDRSTKSKKGKKAKKNKKSKKR